MYHIKKKMFPATKVLNGQGKTQVIGAWLQVNALNSSSITRFILSCLAQSKVHRPIISQRFTTTPGFTSVFAAAATVAPARHRCFCSDPCTCSLQVLFFYSAFSSWTSG